LNVELQKSFNQLELHRSEIIRLISPLSEESFHKKPGDQKWSINQILSHIVSAERLAISYMNKKRLGIDSLENTGVKQDLIMVTLIVSQRIPFLKFKAPKTVVDNTVLYDNKEALVKSWQQVRADLKELLEKFKDDEVKRKSFKHPIAGMLNVNQGVRFMREHIIHHTPQIKRLLS
jgi:Uncharacterized protein conserved in bacteria